MSLCGGGQILCTYLCMYVCMCVCVHAGVFLVVNKECAFEHGVMCG